MTEININYNDQLKVRAGSLTTKIPLNEVLFHKFKSDMKVKVNLTIIVNDLKEEE